MYHIVQILEVQDDRKIPHLIVRRLYRPQDIPSLSFEEEMWAPINKVFWSSDKAVIHPSLIIGKCTVLRLEGGSEELEKRWLENPTVFFFDSFYNSKTTEIMPLNEYPDKDLPAVSSWAPDQEKVRPLATLDMFCGCGGLSEGFKKAGIADVKWAVEFDPDLARIYKKNNPQTKLFCKDCNVILQKIMDGAKSKKFPKKGEVELIIGGPPCQGFSGMNRFNKGDYSRFQNSVVVSYLSYVDYYRPSGFLLENVENFVRFKKRLVIKLVIWALIEMGYQCSYDVSNCGNYGVPQSRQRTIVLAVQSGKTLPTFPKPITGLANKKPIVQTPLRGLTAL